MLFECSSRIIRWLACGFVSSMLLGCDIHPSSRGMALEQLSDFHQTIYSSTFTPDGQSVITGGRGGLRLWDLGTGVVKGYASLSMNETPRRMSLSHDGTTLAVDGASSVKLFDLETLQQRANLQHDRACSVAYSPDGSQIASGSTDGVLKIWDSATGKERVSISAHKSHIWAIAYAPRHGRTIATASEDGTVKTWDSSTGSRLLTFEHRGPVFDVAFAPDGETFASAAENNEYPIKTGETIIWSVSNAQKIEEITGASFAIWRVAYSTDGKTLAIGGQDQTVRLRNIERHEEVLKRRFSGPVRNLSFSRDGKWLIASGGDPENDFEGGWIQLWEPQSTVELR